MSVFLHVQIARFTRALPRFVTVALMRTLRWKAVSLYAATESGDFPLRRASVHQSLTRAYHVRKDLSTLIWYRPRDSNSHCTGFEPALSADWSTSVLVVPVRLELTTPTMSRWCANHYAKELLGWMEGLEPSNAGFTGQCLDHFGYQTPLAPSTRLELAYSGLRRPQFIR